MCRLSHRTVSKNLILPFSMHQFLWLIFFSFSIYSSQIKLPSNTTARLFYSKGFNETALALNNYGEVDVKWKYDMLFGG